MLQSLPVCLVPPETARVATAALSRSNSYIKLRDHLGTVFEDQDLRAKEDARCDTREQRLGNGQQSGQKKENPEKEP